MIHRVLGQSSNGWTGLARSAARKLHQSLLTSIGSGRVSIAICVKSSWHYLVTQSARGPEAVVVIRGSIVRIRLVLGGKNRSASTLPSGCCGSCLGHLPHLDPLPGNGEASLLCQVGGSLSMVLVAPTPWGSFPSLGMACWCSGQ